MNNSLSLVYKKRCPPGDMSFKESMLKAKNTIFKRE